MDTYNKVMVCVTKQYNCKRLIDYGNSIKNPIGELHVVHVAKEGWDFLGDNDEGKALQFLLKFSK